MNFENVSVNGIPLIPFIIGFVQFAKSMGLRGIWLRLLSVGMGIALDTV